MIAIPLIPTEGEFEIFQTDVDGWQESYPGVEILQALRAIREWNISNPTKRKTRRGIRRHITSWLADDQDKGRNRRHGPTPTVGNGRGTVLEHKQQAGQDFRRIMGERYGTS